ncbi:MAG: putative maturation protein [Alehxovirus pseudonemorisadaptatum]|uniref:Maturation protein n=1 Tax=Leviviridae sp. TaxID=2027243 RepID=A0ABY3SU62_9VIRU|nr:MAG: putative maturation protein [Leviviridae sp.]
MTRVRIKSFPYPSNGFAEFKFNGSIVTHKVNDTSKLLSRDYCEDDVGYPVDHVLTITHRDSSNITPLEGYLQGSPGSSTWRRYSNFRPSYFDASDLTHLSLPAQPSASSLATKVLARTNPSKPTVSIFNFLYELKDLPGMIKEIGDIRLGLKKGRRLRYANSAYLSTVMGWVPLFSDLQKLVHFQDSVDRKMNELERLYANGGLKRRISKNLDEASAESTSTVIVESSLSTLIQCKVQKFSTRRSWATVRWVPTHRPSLEYSQKELRQLARNLVFGLNFSPKYVWDTLPWSWMVDWFTNVGDYLGSYSNAVPASASAVNIMTHTVTKISYSRVDGFRIQVPGAEGASTFETKSRVQSGAALSADLPFLNRRQLSILGALAIQRYMR